MSPLYAPKRAAFAWLHAAALVVFASLQPVALAQDWNYTVRPGDTLWGISDRYLTAGTAKAPELQAYNTIEDPYNIPPGSRLRVPVAWLSEQPAPAKAAVVNGEVWRTPAGGDEARLNSDDELTAGDRIRTGDGASATIRFADGSRTVIRPNSELTLDTLSVFKGTGMVDTTMRLHGGRVDNDVPKRAKQQSRFRIVTPSAIAAVRGTGFRVGYDRQNKTALSEVGEGAVGFANDSAERSVTQGFGVKAEEGKPPSQPIELLDPPDLGSVPADVELSRTRFDWPAVPGAVAYQLQIFRGDRLVHDERLQSPSFDRETLANGEYALLVRAIDNNALEGKEAKTDLSISAHPFAPSLDNPVADAELNVNPTFSLTPSEPDHGMRIQVASDEAFEEILFDEKLESIATIETPQTLPSGTYFWRASAVGDDGEAGPFSEARRFVLTLEPDTPEPVVQHFRDNRLWLLWNPVENALGYRFELARDESFGDVIASKELRQSQFVLEFIEAGVYFYRVRSVGAENVQSAFSPPQKVEVYAEISDPLWQLLTRPLRAF